MSAQSHQRFEDINIDEIQQLLEEKDSVNTKRVIQQSVRILRAFCDEKKLEFTGVSTEELVIVLQKFYAGARTRQGELYTKKSMLSMRYGLQKHFEKNIQKDIVHGEEFTPANKVFDAVLVNLKREGKATVQHKEPLNKQDLRKLYQSFDLSKPKQLQNKVFVDFMLYFCNRGRENLREIKKTDFLVHEQQGYIDMKDMPTKNHRGEIADSESQGGRIYRTNDAGEMCPYDSFTRYLSVLHPGCDFFFQRPKDVGNSVCWFDKMPLGKNTLGNKMRTLSAESKLSQVYTNHCLRATSITLLDRFEARHVMTVSGHKAESSIRSYARTSDAHKHEMALTIAASLTGTTPSATVTAAPPLDPETDMVVTPANISTGTEFTARPYTPAEAEWAGADFTLATYFLEMTSSQESHLIQDVSVSDSDSVVATASVPQERATVFHSFKQVQEISRSAPTYYFPHSVVNIHYH